MDGITQESFKNYLSEHKDLAFKRYSFSTENNVKPEPNIVNNLIEEFNNQSQCFIKKTQELPQNSQFSTNSLLTIFLLRFENVLREIQKAEIREDFLNGISGSYCLNKKQLAELDAFYSAIAPSPYSKNYHNELFESQFHLEKLKEKSESHFNYLKYADLKVLLDCIVECDYWKNKGININKAFYLQYVK
jgi:hypothetical protein